MLNGKNVFHLENKLLSREWKKWQIWYVLSTYIVSLCVI
jgi:hypothetical protein